MKILRQSEQARRLGCSRWTAARIAKADPTYPAEIEISAGIRGVAESDFDAWLQSRPLRQRAPIEQTGELHDAHVRTYEAHKAKAATK